MRRASILQRLLAKARDGGVGRLQWREARDGSLYLPLPLREQDTELLAVRAI